MAGETNTISISESGWQNAFAYGPLPPWAVVNLSANVEFAWECFGAGIPYVTQGGSSRNGLQFTASSFVGWTVGACSILVHSLNGEGTLTAEYNPF